jgi:hypothetical protein
VQDVSNFERFDMAKVAFTSGRVKGFKCPADKPQAFLWDVTAPGLGLRLTPAGKPSYVRMYFKAAIKKRLSGKLLAVWMLGQFRKPKKKRESCSAKLMKAATQGK